MLSIITTYAFRISFLVGIICYRKMIPTKLHLWVWLMGLGVLVDYILLNYTDENGKPYQSLVRILYGILRPIELLVVFYIFSYKIKGKYLNTFLKVVCGVSVFYATYKLFYDVNDYSSTSIFIFCGISEIIIILFYFWSLLKSKEIITLQKEPLFWIATALLFFYAGNIISTGFYHQINLFSKSLSQSLYKLNYILNIMQSLVFGYAFYISTLKKGEDGFRD
jgi:hypothetical protein